MNDTLNTECVICGGHITRRGMDICCSDEDQYLLICCKGHLRKFEDRSGSIDDVVVELYHDLDNFLRDRGDKIDNYDESGVNGELEKRVIRWINKKMIDAKSVAGIGYCKGCGSPIMGGRTMCNNCSQSNNMKSMLNSSKPSQSGGGSGKRIGGMHFKR